jgi:hypothetical protein
MLIQNNKGQFVCEGDNFKTTDVFEYLDHAGVEFTWGVKLSDKTSLDMFTFLSMMNDAILIGELDEAYDMIQSAALLLINASSKEADDYVEEAVVRATSNDMIRSMEEMLKNG